MWLVSLHGLAQGTFASSKGVLLERSGLRNGSTWEFSELPKGPMVFMHHEELKSLLPCFNMVFCLFLNFR